MEALNKRVKVKGGWYRIVPAIYDGASGTDDYSCKGCEFDHDSTVDKDEEYKQDCCRNHKFRKLEGDCPEGIIFIKCGKEALAEYMAERISK